MPADPEARDHPAPTGASAADPAPGVPLRYPDTRRDDLVDELHGRQIADPYRWLEDPDSPETRAWVQAQNAVTESFLAGIPERCRDPRAPDPALGPRTVRASPASRAVVRLRPQRRAAEPGCPLPHPVARRRHARAAARPQHDLAAVGIRVNLKTEDWGAYMNNRGGKYPMWMFGGRPSTPDPSYLIYVYYGNKLAQEGNYDNAQVRELMNKAQWMVDQKQRAELYKQAAKITYDEMARVPVVFARASAVAASKKVQGFVTTPWRLEFYKFASFAN